MNLTILTITALLAIFFTTLLGVIAIRATHQIQELKQEIEEQNQYETLLKKTVKELRK